MTDDLKKEFLFYQKQLPSLLQSEGKYAVIVCEELVGVYGSYEDALQAGYGKAQVKPFLVRKISNSDEFIVYPDK
jgi:hypothetical protein